MPQVFGPDANILTQAGGGQNAIGMLGQIAAFQHTMTANALLQQQFRAQQGLQAITQMATGPDGKLDNDKFATLVASHPEVAPIAQDVLNQMAQRRLIDAHTTNAKLTAAQQRMEIMGPMAAAAARDYDGTPGHDSTAFASSLIAAGAIEPGKQREQIPFMAQLEGMPVAQARATLGKLAMSTVSGAEQMKRFNGSFVPDLYTDNQGNKWPGWASGVLGGIRPEMGGAGAGAGLGGPAPAGPLPPSQGFGGGAGAGAAPAAAPALTPRQPGPLLEKTYEYGAKLDDAGQYATTFLNNIKAGEQLLNKAATGRATGVRTEIARWAKAAGLDPATVDRITGGNTDMTQALGKLMLMLGTQSMRQANEGNAAVRSVQEWQKFIEANPNIGNDPGAIRKMWHQMKFQARLVQDEQENYHAWIDPRSGKDPTGFRPAWNSHVNQATNDYLRSVQDKDWDQPTSIGD